MAEKYKTQLSQLEKLIKEVEDVATAEKGPAVGEFLASLMMGKDPRNIPSTLYLMIKRISMREWEGGKSFPTPEEWEMIVTEVLGSGNYEKASVDIEMSQRAAAELMKYLHAKMKSVEVSGNINNTHVVTVLDGKDYDEFKERFKNEF